MTKESGGGAPGDAGGAAAAKGEPSAPAPAVPSGSKVAGSEAPAKGEPPAALPTPPVKAPALTDVYRVGVGDVLDIRLLEDKMGSSTLYVVLAGGLVEYPPLGTPFAAAGKTTDEIAAHIGSELRRLKLSEDPRPVVSVRDYASHTLLVSGLVREPGTKILRREAVPLYVVIADAQPLPEAGRVLLMSEAGARVTEAALDDPTAMGTLVRPGDVVSVLEGQRQFYYIGGEVAAPGQKDFHDGITLTQAILAAGGSLTEIKRVLVTRQAEGGVLSASKYNLKEIMGGGVPDPALRPGDRVETVR